MNTSTKILLVEDDKVTAKIVKKYLELKDFEVTHSPDGKSGYEAFKQQDFDLCILDVMMPHKDGFSLAQDMRKLDEYVPILFVTSKSLSEDKIKAFKIGADDYITKPFVPEELVLRVEATLRRQQNMPKKSVNSESLPNKFRIGAYIMDYPFQKLSLDGKEQKLTAREAELLRFLYMHKNDLIKREYILMEIWGDDDYYKGRSLDVFISRLRKYLKEDPNIQIINVHATGFKFVIANPEEPVQA